MYYVYPSTWLTIAFLPKLCVILCDLTYPHGIGLPFSLWRRCLPPGFHQSPLLSSFYLPCGICPAPACGAYLRVFTNALNLIAIRKVSVDGFPAWFRMFLLFCLMNLINFWLRPLRWWRWLKGAPPGTYPSSCQQKKCKKDTIRPLHWENQCITHHIPCGLSTCNNT